MASLDVNDGEFKPSTQAQLKQAARDIFALLARLIGTALMVAFVLTAGLW